MFVDPDGQELLISPVTLLTHTDAELVPLRRAISFLNQDSWCGCAL